MYLAGREEERGAGKEGKRANDKINATKSPPPKPYPKAEKGLKLAQTPLKTSPESPGPCDLNTSPKS